MKYGKYTIQQLWENATFSMWAIKVHNEDELQIVLNKLVAANIYLKIKNNNKKYPILLTRSGTVIDSLYAIQRDFAIIDFSEIEFNLPEDYYTHVMKKVMSLSDDDKEKLLNFINEF